jgi:hypothetical protein
VNAIQLDALLEFSLGSPIGQLRAMPVHLGEGAPRALLLAYCADFDVDPYVEMFFFPTDTLKLVLVDEHGNALWRRDLGSAVVPGIWFCPLFPFDLNGDGVDEIWFVNNVNVDHPLGLSGYRLERLDAHTGETTGQWPWPALGPRRSLSHTFRNFIVGGMVRDQPVLVTAQGTYGNMYLQGWNADMTPRWEHVVAESDPGARGSHMCPVVDLDDDGVDELMWGERCIELDAGRELFCADRDTYRGHSDIVQPVIDPASGHWCFYTCRESDPQAAPRVAFYDDQGQRIWGAVGEGHIDMGWIARLGDGDRLGEAGQLIASAVRIGHKICGPDGRYHTGMTEYIFDALTGKPLREGESGALEWSTYGTIPVDLNGDGCHELVRGRASRNGEVLDRRGHVLGSLGAPVAMACKFLDRPGEQLLAYYADGTVRAWGDRNAHDSPSARARYAHPFYQSAQRLFGVGYNLTVLGGV